MPGNDDHKELIFPGYRPTSESIAHAQLTDFRKTFSDQTNTTYSSYSEFEQAAIEKSDIFWQTFLKWSDLSFEGDIEKVKTEGDAEHCLFFPDIRLNFAECLLAGAANLQAAVTHCRFGGEVERVSGKDLKRRCEAIAWHLRNSGVTEGDLVVAIARNNLEVAVACIATAAVGAVFSVCSGDMPLAAIDARFEDLQPKVLFANSKNQIGDVGEPLAEKLSSLTKNMQSLEQVILLDDLETDFLKRDLPTFRYQALLNDTEEAPFQYKKLPFNQPLFILFSSGTTGPPKRIVHGAGGTLLEHVKEHRLHCDLQVGDRLFFQTSCSWMMWNWQLSALASGTEIVVYDGPVLSAAALWSVVANEDVSVYGTNPAFIQICENEKYVPNASLSFSNLRSILTTGSTLYDHQFDWLWNSVRNVPVAPISGGTDIIGCFVLGSPVLPVKRGEIQCKSLAMDVRAICDDNNAERYGELVCCNAFPSRPLGFWDDQSGKAFHATYFQENAGVWTHGDLIEFCRGGGIRLHGRSDGVLNIGGIRIGPAEIYDVLADVTDIAEAVAVEKVDPSVPGGARLALLVVLHGRKKLDSDLRKRLRTALTKKVPAAVFQLDVFAVDDLPKTFSGKTSEQAARAAVNGTAPKNALALRNPTCILELQNLYDEVSQKHQAD